VRLPFLKSLKDPLVLLSDLDELFLP
jgi:hypothetical protein